tara:strand:+ start:4422 stop:4619 length:198 start_codon:yes stop_codon:yes gene_type:complete
MALELDRKTILEREVKNLEETIDKMHVAIENSKLDLAATKLIKESLEDSIKTLPEQQEIKLIKPN